jgi:hypothetical protein
MKRLFGLALVFVVFLSSCSSPPTPNPAFKLWVVGVELLGNKAISLDSINRAVAYPDPVRPTLYVQCKEKILSVAIDAHTEIPGDLGGDVTTIKIISDGENDAQVTKTPDDKVLFFGEQASVYLIDYMKKSATVSFEITPKSVSTQTITFDPSGFSEAVKGIEENCK